MKNLLLLLAVLLAGSHLHAQIDASLMRYPDVSSTHIVFTYANDLWLVPKSGGQAVKLSSPAGVESYPRFSPDGREIARGLSGLDSEDASQVIGKHSDTILALLGVDSRSELVHRDNLVLIGAKEDKET